MHDHDEDDDVMVECPECLGGGYVDCDNCSGWGRADCDVCWGTGEVENDDTGEPEPCGACDDGETDCPECDGGEVTCPECDGDGEVRRAAEIAE